MQLLQLLPWALLLLPWTLSLWTLREALLGEVVVIAVPRRWTLLPGVARTDPERILSASADIPVAGVRRTLAAQLVVIGALRTL